MTVNLTSTRGSLGWSVFLTLIVGVALFLVGMRAEQIRHWPATRCAVIQEEQLKHDDGDDGVKYSRGITVQYAGVDQATHDVKLDTDDTDGVSPAVGASVPCWINPRREQDVAFRPPLEHWPAWLPFVCLSALFLVRAIGAFRAREEAVLTLPFANKRSLELDLTGSMARTVVIAGLGRFALSVLFIVIAGMQLHKSVSAHAMTFGLTWFTTGLTLCLLPWVVRTSLSVVPTLAQIEPFGMSWEPQDLAMGQLLRVSVNCRGALLVSSTSLRLLCVEETQHTKGTDTISETEQVLEIEMVNEGRHVVKDGTLLSATTQIPHGQMHTFHGKRNSIKWYLVFASETELGRLAQRVEVNVLPGNAA